MKAKHFEWNDWKWRVIGMAYIIIANLIWMIPDRHVWYQYPIEIVSWLYLLVLGFLFILSTFEWE